MEIAFPSRLDELVETAVVGFAINNPHLVSSMDVDEISQFLQELIDSALDFVDEDKTQHMIDFLCGSIRNFHNFSKENQGTLVQYMIDMSKCIIELLPSFAGTPTKIDACKKILFLFQHLCVKAELDFKSSSGLEASDGTSKSRSKKASSKATKSATDAYNWQEFRGEALEVLYLIATSPLSEFWPMGLVSENFLAGVWGYALKLLVDRPQGVSGTAHREIALRARCVACFAQTMRHFGSSQTSTAYDTVSTTLLEAIVQVEHMGNTGIAAELCAQSRAVSRPQGTMIIAEIMSEISRMGFSHMPAASIRNVAAFLESFAKLAPACIADAFPMLVKQLDAPAHQIRSAILHACGYIISHIHVSITQEQQQQQQQHQEEERAQVTGQSPTAAVDGGDGAEQQAEEGGSAEASSKNTASLMRFRDSVLDILVERTHDVNPYTRSAVFKEWSRLLESGSVPVKRAGHVAEIAVDRLNDKNAMVRRNAVALMTAVIENNPFSGTLDAQLFALQQAEVQKVLAARIEELREQILGPEAAAAFLAKQKTKKQKKKNNNNAAAAKNAKAAGKEGPAVAAAADLSHISEADECDEEDEEDKAGMINEENEEADDHDAEEEEVEEEEEGEDEVDEFAASPEVTEDAVVCECHTKLQFIAAVLSMVRAIENAVPRIAQLLQSRTAGDVVEALRFFTRAINFKIHGALLLFQNAFSLIWHQDEAIRNELLVAFHGVYLTDGATENAEFLSAPEVVRNLTSLVRHCDQAELTSLEKIIGQLFSTGQVEDTVIDALLDRLESWKAPAAAVTGTSGTSTSCGATTYTEIGACLRVLAMVAQTTPEVMDADCVPQVSAVGLHPCHLSPATRDFTAMRAAVLCLQACPNLTQACLASSSQATTTGATGAIGIARGAKTTTTTAAGGGSRQTTSPSHASTAAYIGSPLQQRLEETTPMLARILLGVDCGEDEGVTRQWFALCEETMHCLFHVHPSPDKVLTLIIQRLYRSLESPAASSSAVGTGTGTGAGVCAMSRFLFLLGQASLCSLVFTELIASTSKKFPANDNSSSSKAGPVPPQQKQSNRGKNSAAQNKKELAEAEAEATTFEEDEGEVDAMEEEMGAAAAADADHERILNYIIEQELVMKNLLGKFLPLLSFLVANEQKKHSQPLLRETSTLAMCRYMCTSSVVCESLLPLLFTVLERESSAIVRTTIMIALGDLAFRFPNSIEPWTSRMYARLSDACVDVRYNTLMVITHLVLNDMIKVKGQVSQVAMSLNDDNEAIAELARLFFLKLSERSNNPVYNLLGDIISTFSQESTTQAATEPESKGADEAVAMEHGVQEEHVTSTGNSSSSSPNSAGPSLSTTLPPSALTKEKFQSTMHFLLSFVQKDKQADTLLERLLVRLSMSTSTVQRRNIAFCISELTVTEKGIKKMTENIKHIKDALYDNEVYENFKTVLAKTKKSTSRGGTGATAAADDSGETVSATGSTGNATEIKNAVQEFENLMERIHALANGESVEGGTGAHTGAAGENSMTMDGDIDLDMLPEVPTATGSKPSTRNNSKKVSSKSTKAAGTSSRKKNQPPSKKRSTRRESFSDVDTDDDDENDDDEVEEEADNEDVENTQPSQRQQQQGKSGAGSSSSKAGKQAAATSSRSRRRQQQVVGSNEDEEAEFL